MSLLIRFLVLSRFVTLRRQSREMRRIVESLPGNTRTAVANLAMSEIQNAAKAPVPHLYGSSTNERYQPWGDASSQAFVKARSSVAQLKLRGIALWLAVVYHETRDSNHSGMQAIHRDVLGLLGLLKGTYAAAANARAAARAA